MGGIWLKLSCPIGILITHYIDDILMPGDHESQVREALRLIVNEIKRKRWEISLFKIQAQCQTVTFLEIVWDKGKREMLPKAKQKIINFKSPQNKKEFQKFTGLFGFWKNHIPPLGQILNPLYKVIGKKHQFNCGNRLFSK